MRPVTTPKAGAATERAIQDESTPVRPERLHLEQIEFDKFWHTNKGKAFLAKGTKFRSGDEAVAKHSVMEPTKQKFPSLHKLENRLPPNSDVARITGVRKRSTVVTVGAMIKFRQASDDKLRQWAITVSKDPKCQTRQFCEILRVVAEYMRHSRENDRVPDFTEIRSAIVKRCNLEDSWGGHLENHIRRLIDMIRTPLIDHIYASLE